MREIKFRAWDEKSSEMWPMDYLLMRGDTCEMSLLDEILGKIGSTDHLHIMQYTGLKDKNGVEIYEGDLIKFIFGYEEQTKAVEWKEDYVAFGVDGIMLNQFNYNLDRDGYIPCEVIGNIYDNPELLEAGQ